MNTEKAVLSWRRRENFPRDPTQTYECRGGPFDDEHIVLTLHSDGSSTLFRSGPFVGRYRVLSPGSVKLRKPGTVEWVEDV
jgi:hypothetical protein